MCGFAGALCPGIGLNKDELLACASRMSETLIHRGPDDFGLWADERFGIALGFRRLSIIDLSHEGHQPMVSHSGRYVIAFNGEVYNFKQIRRELEEHYGIKGFKGGSDTEVMLTAIETWGLENAVRKFVGMFAFALWDRKENVLHLVRDRLGVKPLYYGQLNGALVFGSELKALKAFGNARFEIDPDSVALFMRYACVPSPCTIYKDIRKLTPGTILTVSQVKGELPKPKPFWTAQESIEEALAHQFSGSESEAEEELDALLRDCVGIRMVADVPLGVFLSGGIDSSLITAQMQAQSSAPVKTFTIGFDEKSFDESAFARDVAKYLGTDHTEVVLTPQDMLDAVPLLPTLYDEPFADPSQIPTYLVSKLARTKVTVALSGDGGDEFFGGYNTYKLAGTLWGKLGRMPQSARSLLAGVLSASAAMPTFRSGSINYTDKLGKLSNVVDAQSKEELYNRLMSSWQKTSDLVVGSNCRTTIYSQPESWVQTESFEERMMFMDSVCYLPDDILVKVDRASMGVSLEARTPLLDHRLFDFAWRLPLPFKIRAGQGKWILRRVLSRYIPSELIERPKKGFGVPISDWIRGPLQDWAEDLLSDERLNRDGILNTELVRKHWLEHKSGRRDWKNRLWNVLVFQCWLDANN